MGLFRKRSADVAHGESVGEAAPSSTSGPGTDVPKQAAPAQAASAAMPEEPVDPELALTAKRAQLYAAACGDVLSAVNACLEVANAAVGARNMAAKRPQHEISINTFANMADRKDQEFPPLYRAFVATCSLAKQAAASLLQSNTSHDPEFVLLMCAGDERYNNASTARHIMLADFGPTPATFLEGLELANAAIQGDVMNYGEEGFQGCIYSPPLPAQNAERTCPWCAETIKAAAVICRFCGRDVSTSSNTLPS